MQHTQTCFVPRFNSNPTDTALPYKFKRRQFPLVSLAMTVKKAQGQTLHMAGLYLPTQPFCMVNCMWPNRVGSKSALQMVVKCGAVRDQKGVYVKSVVHMELLLR